jgi:hypothetical protein
MFAYFITVNYMVTVKLFPNITKLTLMKIGFISFASSKIILSRNHCSYKIVSYAAVFRINQGPK